MSRFVVSALAFAALAVAGSAHAQSSCADRDSMVATLRADYNESAGGRGLTTGGGVLEIFTSPEGSWTILLTMPGIGGNLRACLVAHGESWESLPVSLKPAGKRS